MRNFSPTRHRLRKDGIIGAFALLFAASCHRVPVFNPPVTPGVAEELAQTRRASISGVAYKLKLTIPEKKAEPIEVSESVSFNLNDNRCSSISRPPLGRAPGL